jgi:predicted ferric reductase/Ca2+-binding EF-hand superfamily protein
VSAPRAPSPPSTRDAALLAILERAFAHHAGKDAVIDPAELQSTLRLRSPYLAKRIFHAFDRDGDGVIRKDEFIAAVRALVAGSAREKLEFAFRVHDDDGDGTLDRDELTRMIAIALAESDTLERATQPAEQLAAALIAKIDTDGDGRVSFEELERAVERRPWLLDKMTRSEAIWIAPNEELIGWLDRESKGDATPLPTADRSKAPRVALALWILANVGLLGAMIARGVVSGQQPAMLIGRALGACIDLNGALILVPMMRGLLTRVRANRLGRALPVDESLDFHKLVGHTLFALAVTHGVAFAIAYPSGHDAGLGHLLAATRVGLTGVILLLVFAVMWVFSLGFIRRTRRFELFYFTHLLYVAWLGLAIAHAPKFLIFAGVPLLGFAVEQVRRLRRRAPASAVVSAGALRSGVTALEVARPPRFTFQAGDYCFVRIPEIARHEWHPFTISSAPERAALGFHVRSLGNWSAALRRHVEEGRGPITAYVDGPYGSPSAHIFQSKNAVLIGAGIGVTPFASVLESIVLRGNGQSERPSTLGHVHFFWLNRDAYSFEWFGALLRELERLDERGMLDVHLCMTGGGAGLTALGLELAREVMHGAGRSDVYTGLRHHTHAGSPDWEKLLGAIAKQHAGAGVDVYFCGPPGLAARLRPICARLGMPFREEQF